MFRQLFVGVVLIAAGVVAACQEPDPNYGDPSGIIGKKLPGQSTGGPATTGTDGAASSSGSSVPTAPAPTITLASAHADSGGVGPPPPVTTDCLTCHGGAGPATAKFAFGGLLTNGNGATVTVQVDGLDPVATDDAGYFWSTSTTAIAAGSNVAFYPPGATQQKGAMPGLSASPQGGSCQSATGCHGAASPGPITLNP